MNNSQTRWIFPICFLLYTTHVFSQKTAAAPLQLLALVEQSVSCNGSGKDAVVKAQATGGTPPYTYQWSHGVAGDYAKNVGPGTYFVTVTDSKGHQSSAKSVVPEAGLRIKTRVKKNASGVGKADGAAEVDIDGNAAGLNVVWDNGELLVEAKKLTPGIHSVTVSDSKGCVSTATVEVPGKTLPLSATVKVDKNIKCAGEKTASLQVVVTGGKSPYTYAWDKPDATGDRPANLGPGDYQITITDAAGTTTTAWATVRPADPIVVHTTLLNGSSGNNDGKALAQAKGGSDNFTFLWDNGETTALAVKLSGGARAVTVTDDQGCVAVASLEMSETLSPLSVSLLEKTAIKCGGSDKSTLQAQVKGGKAPYQYYWSTGSGSGKDALGLRGGTYSVSVVDTQGDTAVSSYTVQEPPMLQASVLHNIGASTDKSNDGKAEIAASGGTGAWQIVWDNKQTGATANKLAPGKHSVTVSDANGCTEVLTFETAKRIVPELAAPPEKGKTIRMRSLNFDPDSSTLKVESLPQLDELYEFLKANQNVSIEVGGHTNNQASDDFADKLSTSRAKAVADYLIDKGIAAGRVMYKGYGKRHPIASNLTPEGKKANQRVEIRILKTGD